MFSIVQEYPNLVIVVSEKKDGPMKFCGDPDKDKNIRRNRENYFKKLGIDSKLVVAAGLVHGSNVSIVSGEDAGDIIDKTDGLLTQDDNLFLSITVADCLPVFLYDPTGEIVGLIHCGWRSLTKNIIPKSIQKLKTDLNCKIEKVLVGIGPGISKCHFGVEEEVLAAFQDLEEGRVITRARDKMFLDLKEVVKIQLIKNGIKEKNIEISPECTYCLKDKYFSYRRDKPDVLETMIVVFGKRK